MLARYSLPLAALALASTVSAGLEGTKHSTTLTGKTFDALTKTPEVGASSERFS